MSLDSNGHGAGNVSSSSNNSHASHPASDVSSPPAVTPEIKPTLHDHDKNVASPLLEALSTTSVSASTAPSMANEWARGAIMAGSPGNLINLNSESPPTQPSSYEDSGRLHHAWPAAHRPFMSPSPASPSPPHSNRRPLSFQMDAQYHVPGTSPRGVSTVPYRRSSLHSPYPNSRASPHPPLPHQPQPHFYGAHDLDLTITPQSGGMKPGDHGFFFGFDRLPSPDSSTASEQVVLAGYEGGLQVYAVGKRGIDLVANLKGLRGGVHHAKILPWTIGGDAHLFPLVAVVVHGPVLPPRAANGAPKEDAASRVTPDDGTSPRPGFAPLEGIQGRPGSALMSYQTAVEVYSLKTNKLVDVLLQAQKVPINTEVSLSSPLFQPPPPTGALTIKADSGTIAVCSGTTGECWVYRQLLEPQNSHFFACSGKIWTTIQQGRASEVPEESDKTYPSVAPHRPSPQTPILALNGHWIAYCPAAPSSQISLRAHIPVPILGRAPGVSSMTPPHLPAVTSSVDLPISDSMVNKIMRETTQELIQGAKWVGQQGLQAWNSYWNKPSSPQSQPQQARSPPQQWAGSRSPQTDAAQFPPTHGTSSPATAKEPGIVAILDTETLASSNTIHPLTTFATPLGCSFLSFSPSSLALFTASTKGDVQTVWDLLRIQHTHSSPLQTTLAQNDSSGPLVRQVAQFSRMTVARIVDVVWTAPQGERLAMVTERGTIHLLDMPFSSFMWPPPRRRKVAAKSATEQTEVSGSAVSMASGAFGAAYQAAMPFVTRSRRSSGNVPATPANTLRDSAAQGGRAIAATISHSLGKTGTAISQLRHTGENRVALPTSAVLPSGACVAWLRGRRSQVLVSAGGGLVRLFPCKARRSSTVAGKRIARANKYKDFKVPLLPDDVVAPIVRQILELGAVDEYLELSDAEMEAGNTMTLKGHAQASPPVHGMDVTIPQAEIESSAPYQPFHTDRRVALCEYVREGGAQLESASVLLANTNQDEQSNTKKKKKRQPATESHSSESSATGAWAFGQDMPTVRKDLGLQAGTDDDISSDDHLALPPSAMERVMQYGDEEHIVVTTRRRRGPRSGEGDEDGFFEDDCEVLDFADQRV